MEHIEIITKIVILLVILISIIFWVSDRPYIYTTSNLESNNVNYFYKNDRNKIVFRKDKNINENFNKIKVPSLYDSALFFVKLFSIVFYLSGTVIFLFNKNISNHMALFIVIVIGAIIFITCYAYIHAFVTAVKMIDNN